MTSSQWTWLALPALLLCACGNAPAADHSANPTDAAADTASTPVACAVDADCVPATCCHPTACVPKAQAPDCREMMCTADCRPGTIDCVENGCGCEQGRCIARIPAAADPPAAPQ